MVENAQSKMVRAGKRTYFIEVKKTKTGQNYLLITESKAPSPGKEKRERSTILVFDDAITGFIETLNQVAHELHSTAS